MLSRRALVGKLAVGTAGAAVALATTGRANAVSVSIAGTGKNHEPPVELPKAILPEAKLEESPSAEPIEVSAPPPWELLAPLTLGSEVLAGWRVADFTSIADGSCVVSLQSDTGRTNRIHICRNDGRPQGLLHTNRFDLVVMNGGQGDLPTPEGFAQAVAELARVLARHEDAARYQPVIAALLPHAERLRRFAPSISGSLR